MLLKRFFLYIIFILSYLLVPAAQAFDLIEAWQATRQFNPEYATARVNAVADREKIVQSRALLLPQVSLSSSYTQTVPAPLANQRPSNNVIVSVNQPLFDVSKWGAYQKAKLKTHIAETQFLLSQQQLLAQVLQAYFDVLLAQDTLTATQASRRAYLSQRKKAQFAFEIGTATQVDVNEAQASYDGALAKEISDQRTLTLRQQRLAHLTGLEPTQLQPVTDRLPFTTEGSQQSLEEWVRLAQMQNYNLKLAEYILVLSTHEVTQKKGGHLPVVSLNAAYTAHQHGGPNFMQANQRQHQIGIGVSIPLFSGGSINSEVREALSHQEAARYKWQTARQQVHEAVHKAFSEITNGAALIAARRKLLESTQIKVSSTKRGHEIGMRSQLELLLAEQSYYDVLSSLAEAKYQYLSAHVQLRQATGELTETWLSEFQNLIQPNNAQNSWPESLSK